MGIEQVLASGAGKHPYIVQNSLCPVPRMKYLAPNLYHTKAETLLYSLSSVDILQNFILKILFKFLFIVECVCISVYVFGFIWRQKGASDQIFENRKNTIGIFFKGEKIQMTNLYMKGA